VVVAPAGVEPAARGLGNRCSIRLSYGAVLQEDSASLRDQEPPLAPSPYSGPIDRCSCVAAVPGDAIRFPFRSQANARNPLLHNAESVQCKRRWIRMVVRPSSAPPRVATTPKKKKTAMETPATS
jgi:hypothetical protein